MSSLSLGTNRSLSLGSQTTINDGPHIRTTSGKPRSQSPNRTKPERSDSNVQVRRKDSFAERWWIFEILALIISFLSLVTLTVILIRYNGRPLTDWTSHISLNAVVSVTSAISRSLLVYPLTAGLSQWKWLTYRKHPFPLSKLQHFDDAASGPWGALQLFFRPPYPPFIALGAFAMGVAVAFEPFVQQSLTFPSRQIVVGEAFMPRSTFFNVSFDQSTRYGAAMEVAIYQNMVGLGTPAVKSTISPNCKTGNCEWKQYTSIGVCSQCADITNKLVHTYPNSTIEWDTCLQYNLTQGCPYTVSGPNGRLSVSWDGGLQTTVMNITTFDQSAYSVDGFTYTALANVSVIGQTSVKETVGFDCVFSSCAKVYTGSVVNGVFSERVLGSYFNTTPVNTSVYPFMYGHDPTPGLRLFTTIPGSALLSGQDEVLSVDYDNIGAISGALSATLGPEVGQVGVVYGSINSDNRTFSYDPSGGSSSPQLLALYANGMENFPQAMESVADGLTNYMRLASTETAVGLTTGPQVYIHVRWIWLALPFALEVFAMTFLVGTLGFTLRSDVPAWKVSSLVLYFHGDDRGALMDACVGETETAMDMQRVARRTTAVLTEGRDNKNLRLRCFPASSLEIRREDEKEATFGRKFRRTVGKIPDVV
jgi:Protein of unknown function (DUF3176)